MTCVSHIINTKYKSLNKQEKKTEQNYIWWGSQGWKLDTIVSVMGDMVIVLSRSTVHTRTMLCYILKKIMKPATTSERKQVLQVIASFKQKAYYSKRYITSNREQLTDSK